MQSDRWIIGRSARSSIARRCAVWALWAAAVTGCASSDRRASSPPPQSQNAPGGEAPTGAATESSASKSGAPADMAPAAPAPQSAPAPRAAPAPEPATSPVDAVEERSGPPSAADPHGGYSRARAQLWEARRKLDIATGQRDCANACRALDSMERALGQLCDLARSPEERRTCGSAEDQVRSARERVKNACGECSKK